MMIFGHRKLLFSEKNLHMNDSSEDDHRRVPLPVPASLKNSNKTTILILMLCILGAAFVLLCYFTMLKRYRTNLSNSRRRNSLSGDDNRENFVDANQGPELVHPIWYIQTVGLQQSVIDSIAVFKYKKGEGLIEGTDCSVCLSEFEEDESLRLLPKCSHAFHITCIDTWLRSHKNCPLCRAPIVRDTNISTDTPRVVAGESGLDNSVSGEDTSGNDQQENHEVGEGGVSEVRIGIENMGILSNEEGKILEMVRRNSNNFIAGKSNVRVLSDLVDHRVRVGEESQPVRRSISLDLPSASMIYAAVAKLHQVKDEGCSIQDVEVKKQTLDTAAAKQGNKNLSIHRSRKSFSFGRSLQSVPIRMKRSFSTSGKVFLHRPSRSQELVQTL